MNRTECIGRRDDESHVFVCRPAGPTPGSRTPGRPCASKSHRSSRESGLSGACCSRIEHDRIARRRRRWIAAAAAAALFSFCAGLAHENASAQPTASPEDEYASLATPSTTPSALDGLIPN